MDQSVRRERIEAAARKLVASVERADKATLHLRVDEAGVGWDAYTRLLIELDDSADGERLRAHLDATEG